MDILINVSIQFFVYSIYFLTINGYGNIFKKIFFENSKLGFGEKNLFSFLIIYFIVLIINFFSPINNFFSIIFIILGIILGLKKKDFIKIDKKFFAVIFFYCFVVSITTNIHDDAYWYQLPQINTLQNYKIIFGITNINHFIYGQSFYDIKSIFQLPHYKNTFVYLIPIIFLNFFFYHLYEISQKKQINQKILFLILFTLGILLTRYTRSKEFGIDLPSQLIIIYFYINTLLYLNNNDKNIFIKNVLIIIFGFSIKLYILFILPFILLFKKELKNIFKIIKQEKKIFIFSSIFIVLTLTKSLINTGCFIYPVSTTCIDKKYLNWSSGSNVVKKVKIHLEAGSKGYNVYTKQNNDKFNLTHEKFLEKYKYNFFKYVIKDKDFERLLIVITIFILVLIFNLNINKNNTFNYKRLFFAISFLCFICWIFIGGMQSRYGGNALLAIFLSSIIYSQNLFQIKIKKKFLFYFITLLIIFSLSKNITRIINEYSNLNANIKHLYPLKKFKIIEFEKNNKFEVNVNISKHPLYCFNIAMLCSTKNNFNAIKAIKNKNNYIFITANEDLKIKSIFNEQEYITSKYYSKIK